MAATGYTPISLYYSTSAGVLPTNTNLVDGELAINITDGKLYYKDNTGTVQVIASKSGAAGIVSAVSVASANGFAGTSSGGATPALTLSTTVTGVLKGNGTAISAAVSGTDYAPATSGTSILKGNGSGGFSNAIAGTDYAPATSGTSILYGSGSGGFSSVTIGSGLTFSTGTLSVIPFTFTGFTGAENSTAPNNTIYVDSMTASASVTDADVAFVAKGAGATLAQVPNSAISAGNKRGTYATDWQKSRSAATQVASGSYSTISGGDSNTANALYAAIGGGTGNSATGQYSAVSGGVSNTANSNSSFIGGGSGNYSTAYYSVVAGGQSNYAQGQSSFVGGGYNNAASVGYATIGGGTNNICDGAGSVVSGGGNNRTNAAQYVSICGGNNNFTYHDFSTIAGGVYGSTRAIGYVSFPASNGPVASGVGMQQGGLLILGRQTTTATATVLYSDATTNGATNQLVLANNSAFYVKGTVVANVTGAGNTKSWYFTALIKRGASAGTTAIVGTPTITSDYADAGASTWSVALSADTTNGALKVTVTGQASTTIRWVCKLETTEVTF